MEKSKKDAILCGALSVVFVLLFIINGFESPKWDRLMLAIVNAEPVLRYLLKLEEEKSKLFIFLTGAPAIGAVIVYWYSLYRMTSEEQLSSGLH